MKQQKPIIHGRDHVPGGPDPIPGLPTLAGTDVADLIQALPGLDAFWKLNEATGTVAHDSSGNGHDLSVQAVNYTPTAPAWAQPAGPPGDQTAHFGTGADGSRLANSLATPMSAFTDDFTAGVWVNVHSAASSTGEILGQSYPYHALPGWGLLTASNKFAIFANGTQYAANGTFSVDTWYFVALVRDAGSWKLYVNGLLQASTGSTSPGSGYGGNTWIGSDDYIAGGTSGSHGSWLRDADLSYAFIASSVISGTDLLALYDAGLAGGTLADGLVWTTDGTGGASWQPNLETIAKNGSTPLTGDVTLTAGTGVTLTQAGQNIEIAATGGGGPTGAAGGALDGSYPNPGLAATVAGAGLAETSDVLSVNVDGSTLEISSDTVRVKADGITAAQIAVDAVGASEIAAGAVGASELADTTVTPGSYGDATHVAAFTVDQDGRLTAASNVTAAGGGGASAADTKAWLPLTTTNSSGDDVVVFDADHSLIPTLVPF